MKLLDTGATCLETATLFSRVIVAFIFSSAMCEWFGFSMFLPAFGVLTSFYFGYSDRISGKWYIIVVLTLISQWLKLLSIFSCTYLPFIYALSWSFCSNRLSTFFSKQIKLKIIRKKCAGSEINEMKIENYQWKAIIPKLGSLRRSRRLVKLGQSK